MTAEILSLRRIRKALARIAADAKAAENRALSGRSRAERRRQAQEAAQGVLKLDGHRLDGPKRDDG